jgi:hypothetical protein
MDGNLFAAVFIAIVAVAVFIQRRRLAHMQALTLGGSIRPGCVIVEAVVLLLIAVGFAIAHFSGVS